MLKHFLQPLDSIKCQPLNREIGCVVCSKLDFNTTKDDNDDGKRVRESLMIFIVMLKRIFLKIFDVVSK